MVNLFAQHHMRRLNSSSVIFLSNYSELGLLTNKQVSSANKYMGLLFNAKCKSLIYKKEQQPERRALGYPVADIF